ncbi:MAG: hypothetical protein K2Q97_08815 [Burkholderiaceae bacterium]|nr:hypothetical protein [Burkholderiaceae bacterium]
MGFPHNETRSHPLNQDALQGDVDLGTEIALHTALDSHEPRTGYRTELDDRTPRYGQYGMLINPQPNPTNNLNPLPSGDKVVAD